LKLKIEYQYYNDYPKSITDKKAETSDVLSQSSWRISGTAPARVW